jgi:hypothetical protein
VAGGAYRDASSVTDRTVGEFLQVVLAGELLAQDSLRG